MKKFYAILIFSVFFFTQIGYFLMYSIVRTHEDKAMVNYLFSSLRDKECEAINFHDNADKIYWQKDGTDFLLDGVEYDVVKTKLIDGRVYLLCITDT